MLTAQDIMTKDVITVPPDLPVERLAALLWEKRISGVPVVDEAGTVLAVVTESDLIDQTKKLHLPTVVTILDSVIFLESPDRVEDEIKKITGTKVMDICTKKLISVNIDTPLDEIASIMAEKKAHTLPVLQGGRLVGVIGKADIIRTLIRKV